MDDVVGDVTTAGGDDTLNGGGGSDLITGDNTTVIAPTVGITLNTNHHGHRHRHGHDDGHHHTQGGHDVLSSLTSFVGDDVIYGGDGADFITGDDAIRLAPQMDITVNNASASHHKHDQDLDRYDLFLDDVVGPHRDCLCLRARPRRRTAATAIMMTMMTTTIKRMTGAAGTTRFMGVLETT